MTLVPVARRLTKGEGIDKDVEWSENDERYSWTRPSLAKCLSLL